MADEQKTYANQQAIVDDLQGPGWRVVGQRPYYVTEPDPGAAANQPQTKAFQRGVVLSIMGPNGQPDEITVGTSDKDVIWDTTVKPDGTMAPLPPALTVIKGPQNQPSTTTPRLSAAGLERLDANLQPVQPGATAVYVRDPNAPAGTTPFKIEPGNETGDPTRWTVIPADPADAEGAKLVYDPASKKVIATVPATAGSRSSGEYANVIDPNDPDGKRVIGLRDKGSNQIFSVSRDPNLQKQIVTTPNKVFVFNDDGSVANTIDVTPNMPPVVVPLGNKAFVFNPKDGTWAEGPSVDEPATVGVSTQNEFYVFFDKNGKEVSRVKNPSYQGPAQTTQGTQSATAPFVQQWNQKTGQWEWVENKGRVTIGEATQNLIKDLTGQTVDPHNPLTLEEASTLLTTAINRMNADAQQAATAQGAAANILSGQQQGAQTGAGLLQQRSVTAQNLVQQGLNLAQSTGGRYGDYSGGLLNPVPGVGQELVSGAANFATELGGGQAVFDTAVRMVQAADPNNSNPDRAAAVATLTQVMDRYRQATGQDHPTVAATKALAASTANQGLNAPMTVPGPPPALVQPWQRADQMYGAAPAGNALAPAGVAGAVAPGSPMYLGTMPVTQAQPRSLEQLGFTAPGGAMRFM